MHVVTIIYLLRQFGFQENGTSQLVLAFFKLMIWEGSIRKTSANACVSTHYIAMTFYLPWNSRIKTHCASDSRLITSKPRSCLWVWHIREVMPQHVTCNVRECDVSIIKSRLKPKDCIFFPLDFGLISFSFPPSTLSVLYIT